MTTSIQAFEDGTLDLHRFGHAEHVRVAWSLIHAEGATRGLVRFEEGLRRLTAQAGIPGRYNATVTYALFFLIAERVAASGALSWEEFAEANGDLLVWPSPALEALYDEETLATPLARSTFVLPRA